MPAPTPKSAVPDHVKAARRQAAERLIREEADAERTVATLTKLKDHADHPATEETVADATTALEEHKAKTKAALSAAGVTRAEITKVINPVRKEELTQQIAQWKQLRDVHQDFIDNPAAYNGVDLGGAPLVEDQQKRMVAEYDAAIAAAEAERAAL